VDFDWAPHLAEQLSWHWEAQLPAEPFADAPFADLVLHIHWEAVHHGAEIALLRDLYLRQG
jgi:hypothetical protein